MKYTSIRPNPYRPGFITESGPAAQVKDVDTLTGIVDFYAAAFGNKDEHREIIDTGAFTKTIVEWGPAGRKRTAHLMDHNPTNRVAVPQEITEDNHGLRVISKFLDPQKHSRARDALIEYSEGAITEHSIGFDIIQEKKDDDTGVWHLQELKLFEVSGVTWGANMETPVLDVKDLSNSSLAVQYMADQMKAIERCLRREVTDEAAIDLEQRLNQLDAYLQSFKSALYAEHGPLHRDSTPKEPQEGLTDQLISIITNLKVE